jgi:hypothetical protein
MPGPSFQLIGKKMRWFASLRRDRRILLPKAGMLLPALRVVLALCPFRFLRRGLGAFEPACAGTAAARAANPQCDIEYTM